MDLGEERPNRGLNPIRIRNQDFLNNENIDNNQNNNNFNNQQHQQLQEYPPLERPHLLGHSTSSFSQADTLAFTSRDDSFNGAVPLLSYPSSSSNSLPTPRVQFQSTVNHHPGYNNNNESNYNDLQQQQLNTQVNSNNGYSNSDFRRKKSLVRPDRERVDENHRLFNYRNHTAAMEVEGRGVTGVSRTGHYAMAGLGQDGIVPNPAFQDSTNLRRGKSILAREDNEVNETGLSMFKRGATLRRPNHRNSKNGTITTANQGGAWEKNKAAKAKDEPLGPWMIYCLALTLCCPSPLLKCFGLRTKERISAWREKMGLLSIVAVSMAAVGFLTFGFTKSVCGTPAQRYKSGEISSGSMIYHGYNYDLDKFAHPAAPGIAGGSNPLYNLFGAASMDGSFLFQTVNQKCLNIITPAIGTGIKTNGKELGWYFPCNLYNQWGSSAVNKTGYAEGTMCHTQADARAQFSSLIPKGQVYFNWSDLKNSTRNLGVYNGAVLDFSLLNWLDVSQVAYPPLFDQIKNGNSSYRGQDITSLIVATDQRAIANCMLDIIRVGFIDSVTIGCVASDVVLYVALAVIIGVVVLRFIMAVVFGWFLSWKIGRFPNETAEQRRARSNEIENWTDDIYRPAAARYRPNVANKRKTMLPTTSRFSKGDLLSTTSSNLGISSSTLTGSSDNKRESKFGDYRKSMVPSMYGSKGMLGAGMRSSPPGSPGGGYKGSRSSTSLHGFYNSYDKATADGIMGACPFPLGDVIPQPSTDFEPFNYPLSHVVLLVTAYSESVEGLRTTLDSLATTDYPNSHKVILVIADGMVKGSGNSLTTPEIALSMMKELVVPSEDVEALSYVAIADGHKQHNRAKIFAGYYEYDNNTVELSKQQRVPMMLIAKVGNSSEAREAKPGNRGKRDSQIILMAFLQKVMFDERMSAFEYEFFNSMWRCTGVSPEKYEMVLCVDADTKVFPDSVSRMVSCMVNDPEIMGLCGETKIANKTESWVTMIQVFEYYVSHHLTKAFESVFGGVTCLPGCFSMYRIKSPKGGEGYWVPILANPDIVEHYSENVVDTLHKKNLLLLGEDRYLTTLMLRTFPRRKMMFCPQAVCKTVVPDTFMVLLSQRRRWINSTVHNLFELFIVPDLCGVFCFSMRFVIFMELVGTLVLPAAISFTIYLIVISIIPGQTKPIIPLILLAFILGLPGLLIVTTSRKFTYLGWMLIYLLSLPIWNLVLPLYAFFHMDDFSWGETRKIVGDTGKAHNTDKDGLFDSSHIVMKRWADFERDRRYKSGSQSRDSTFDNLRSNSPGRTASNRYSVISSADTFNSMGGTSSGEALYRRSSPAATPTVSNSESGHHGPRYPPHLELPAPLSNSISSPTSTSSPDLNHQLPFEPPLQPYNDLPISVQPRSVLNSTSIQQYPRYEAGYDSDEVEREAILTNFADHSPIMSRSSILDPLNAGTSAYHQRPEREQRYVEEPESLSSSSSSSANIPVTLPPLQSTVRSSSEPRKPRGVSLVDAGPVPGSEGMRVVQRQRRHDSTTSPTTTMQSPRSRNSLAQLPPAPSSVTTSPIATTSPSLPPGAAPPSNF